MLPGSFAAKAMVPGAPLAEYVLISSDEPPIFRFRAPIRPGPPTPPPRPVDIWMESVIQENSPASATTLSPGSRAIDSTGIVVPSSWSCMGDSFRWEAWAAALPAGHPQVYAAERGRRILVTM